MGRVGVIVQARMSSGRLPGKVLRDVAGTPLLGHLLARLQHAAVDAVVVATSDRADDDRVAAYAARHGADVHRGPLDDVLGRVAGAARAHRLQRVVRVCGDSPLLDPALVGEAVRVLDRAGADLASNVVERTFPVGQSVEAMTRDALERADLLARDARDREHVTRLMYGRPHDFRIASIRREPPAAETRLVVDTDDDLERVTHLVRRMDRPSWRYGLDELLAMVHGDARAA